MLGLALAGVAFLSFSGTVQAGILSGLVSIFGVKEPVVNVDGNSQNVALLVFSGNADSKAAGGGDTTIVGGQALLPDSGPLGTVADIPNTPKSGHISIYVVREGDTLSQIAAMFDVSVNTIMWGNDIKRSTSLQAGQVLTILPISGVSHTVAKGDTLKSVARQYHADIDEIAQYNDLSVDGALAVGTKIIIPDGEISASSVSTGTKPSPNTTPSYAGYYLRPVAGGYRSQGAHGFRNSAVDLATYYGAPVFAAAEGTVIISRIGGWNGGYGNYVVIQHPNGTQTLYSHMSEVMVVVGQHVDKGDTIAKVGLSGKTTGAHVHFEIRGAKNPF